MLKRQKFRGHPTNIRYPSQHRRRVALRSSDHIRLFSLSPCRAQSRWFRTEWDGCRHQCCGGAAQLSAGHPVFICRPYPGGPHLLDFALHDARQDNTAQPGAHPFFTGWESQKHAAVDP